MLSVLSVCHPICTQGGGSHVTTHGPAQTFYLGTPRPVEYVGKRLVGLRRKAFLFTIFVARNSRSNKSRPLMLVTGEMNVEPNDTMLRNLLGTCDTLKEAQ